MTGPDDGLSVAQGIRCCACGLAGGHLVPATYDDLPVAVRDAFRGLPVERGYVCGGPLFADDGPAACLRRMAGKQHGAYTEPQAAAGSDKGAS